MNVKRAFAFAALAAALIACGGQTGPQPIATINPNSTFTTVSDPTVDVELNRRASGPITFIDFYAEWCGVCKRTAPALAQLRTDLAADGKVIFASYDIDAPASREIVRRYRVSAVPTFIILDADEEVLSRFSGGFSYQAMREKIERYIR